MDQREGGSHLGRTEAALLPLVSNLEIIAEDPNLPKPDLESFPSVFVDESTHKHCWQQARDSWLFVFKPDKVVAGLKSPPSNRKFQYLKKPAALVLSCKRPTSFLMLLIFARRIFTNLSSCSGGLMITTMISPNETDLPMKSLRKTI
ncbi:MAG: hypothetical protein HY978_04240 [Candidatus Liptonbacteria bacterium]|nr:hypothetical protein [Candidatus Liptonbacteria bacterium]